MLDEIYHAIDPIAFQLGPLTVRWYGLGYIVGIVLGMYVLYRTAKHWNIRFSADTMLTVMLAAAIGIIVGGRIGFILFYNLEYYLAHPLEIFAFSRGGMSFHGGLLGMIIAVALAARFIKMPFLTLCDLVAIGAPIGLFLVRCANFINGELWGAPTDLPWGVVFDGAGSEPRHPTQLYEAMLEGVVIFVVLFVLSRRVPPRPRGFFVGVFMLLYGVFRIAVEFVRIPDAQIGYLLGTDWLTTGMVLSFPMICLGVIALIFVWRTRLPQKGCLPSAVEVARDDAGKDSDEDADESSDTAAGEDLLEDLGENSSEVADEASEGSAGEGSEVSSGVGSCEDSAASPGEGSRMSLDESVDEDSGGAPVEDLHEATGEVSDGAADKDTGEAASGDLGEVGR